MSGVFGDVGRPPMNSSEHLLVYPGNVTTDDDGGQVGGPVALLPVELVVVLVLAAACVIVGVVYAYLHITRAARARIDKRQRRPSSIGSHNHHRRLHHASRDHSVDEGPHQTHLMFFRRNTST